MKGSTIAKSFTIAAFAALALSVAPTAKADDRGCSNATLRGTFAQTLTGFGTPASGSTAALANVLALTFDGQGGVTGAGAANNNGNVNVNATRTGAYTVNPDCTGTYAVMNGPSGFTSHFFFVIDDDGNEIQAICIDPFAVFSGAARRLFRGKAI